MRGKAAPVIDRLLLPRITPAYAGKSFHKCHRIIKSGDHPRLCGEKFIFTVNVTLYSGITPAYAGKRSTKRGINQIL